MVAGEQSNGYNVQDTDWNDLVDRLAALEASVLNTGASVGDASLDGNIGWKGETGTLSVNGRVTVDHELGYTPDEVFIQMKGDPTDGGSTSGPYNPYVISPTSTQFTVVFMKTDGTNDHGASGQGVSFAWWAPKATS